MEGPPGVVCGQDSDCVQVPADCCGCARGGVDTAVPAAEADGFLGGLGCPEDPDCPDVDVCDPALVPRCIGGSCQLGSPPTDWGEDAGTGLDPSGGVYCGTADYPPCPAGEVCCLNGAEYDDANSAGVGVCQVGPCQ
jgi:hypothetical protein